MKKCPMCGVSLEDHVTECPECGCPIADTSGFSLKNSPGGRKKSGNPMGKTISSGSGLTDILREGDDAYDDYDDSSVGGSIPISLTRTDIEGDYSSRRKGKIGKYIFRIVLLAAVAYGVYYLITNVFTSDRAKSYDEALEYFVEAVNNDDAEKMELIIPKYVKDTSKKAKDYLENISMMHINSYQVKDLDKLSKTEVEALQDAIKLETGETARIKEAYGMTVELKVTVEESSSQYVKGTSMLLTPYMEFININNKWYLQVDSYENIDYN
ncbi:MAG: hypothetical protein IJ141_09670 [Lachnospiraceae bacterium]|nr:hypothetical protein [Lachnospiraceae bacterium]